ncbi:hypothetical protein FNF27_06824 [Cafeteria roenbergensis]|uniref:Transmembrane 9 superfamily member n=1 Tax=Cafeteria roenbergensis TaxID=33653 RepID=A0A5A8CAS2_CAFRO|nr:hypothetical protein FNF29_05777 [Cafeteria roenbergensis]KAA0169799.1 hypothetical protein FNF27_06824 [Cafeteria roenbergensis]|eukprot:KAA0149767.1 hypothetical protein FNF29_05777 [Cafeteria roenbergensis]
MRTALVVVALWGAHAFGDQKVTFALHDRVPLVANKVGPYTNPSETYSYYSLPFCAPDEVAHQGHNLGEYLSGDRKVLTPYDLRFRTNVDWAALCDAELDQAQVQQLANAIEEDYFFEFFLDGLPLWGFVGDSDETDPILADVSGEARHTYLYKHLHFSIAHNNGNIVGVNLTTDASSRELLKTDDPSGMSITFSYSSEWHAVDTPWEDRMTTFDERHQLPTPLEVHWLSIINSLVLVVLLTACLAIILLRIVNHDFAIAGEMESGEAIEDEISWKLLHADVFRLPSGLNLLTAFVGAGSHLFATTLIIIVAAVTGIIHVSRRGAVISSLVVVYTLTTAIGGFVSARLYRKLRGDAGHSWAWNILLSILVFPAVIGTAFVAANSTAFAHGSSQAVPFGTILLVLGGFVVIGVPLGVVGGAVGRRTLPYKPPARPSARARAIPSPPIWHSFPVQLFLAGFLPFSAISIELHFLFAAVWGHKVYTLFGILLIVFALLTVVCASIVVGLVYFQLASEDYRWWWRSFLCGGMVGVFIFAYAVFFYHGHTDMTGLLQASFFFGYMASVAAAFFLMFGAVGFTAAFAFVHTIYGLSKSE